MRTRTQSARCIHRSSSIATIRTSTARWKTQRKERTAWTASSNPAKDRVAKEAAIRRYFILQQTMKSVRCRPEERNEHSNGRTFFDIFYPHSAMGVLITRTCNMVYRVDRAMQCCINIPSKLHNCEQRYFEMIMIFASNRRYINIDRARVECDITRR